MRILLQLVSWIALAGTILPSILFLTGKIDLDQPKWIMAATMVVWFVATPLWMGRDAGAPVENANASE